MGSNEVLNTGIGSLDSVLKVLRPGALIVIGGRPATGKTTLAFRIACNVAKAPMQQGTERTVVVFSLDMSTATLQERMSAQTSGETSGHSSQIPVQRLMIDDTVGLTVDEVCRRSRTIGIQLLIVDYLQLLKSTAGHGIKQGCTDAAMKLKGLAEELNVPVVVTTQISRPGIEHERPLLADGGLAEIEKYADIICVVRTGWLDVIKNRHGLLAYGISLS